MSNSWGPVTSEGWDYSLNLDTGRTRTRKTGHTGEWILVPPTDALVNSRTHSEEIHYDTEGKKWSRKVYPSGERGHWKPCEQPSHEQLSPEIQKPNKYVFLVREAQGDGQPLHWSLVITASEKGGMGDVYRVGSLTGAMHFAHETNINIFTSASYVHSYRLGELNARQEERVREGMPSVLPPPSAKPAEAWRVGQDWVAFVVQLMENSNFLPPGSAAICNSLRDCDEEGANLFGRTLSTWGQFLSLLK